MTRLSRIVRGLYFLRFPVALWASLLVFIILDQWTGAGNITRAILTPESPSQALSAGFMIFCCGMVVLLNVRLIALNGHERFGTELPEDSWPRQWFGQDLPRWLFFTAHVPGVAMLVYVAVNIAREEVWKTSHGTMYALFAGYLLVGYFFWMFLALVYLWSFTGYRFMDANGEIQTHARPRRLIFPRGVSLLSETAIGAIANSTPPLLIDWLERGLFQPIAHLGNGFARKDKGGNLTLNLYEGHRLAAVAILALLAVYIYLFAYTAPVPLPHADWISNGISVAALLAVLVGTVWPNGAMAWQAVAVKFMAAAFVLYLIVLVARRWGSDRHGPREFAVFASVMVLVVGLLWLLTTIAFITDGSRFPVLSGSLALLLLLKLFHVSSSEHYFTATPLKLPVTDVQTPDRVLDARLTESDQGGFQPLIVVTAEGGGIHSAAWTSAVLMELEHAFHDANPRRSFHDNILLASGVSGGSDGLLPFLREYTTPQPFSDLDQSTRRVTGAARCSSLEAAAWGLSYYDAINFLVPIPWLVPWIAQGDALTYTGSDPARKLPPAGADRSWALERAFDRNLGDPACIPQDAIDKGPKIDSYNMSLNWAVKQLADRRLPAFTFNTTVVETGDRFLLANYRLPRGASFQDVVPASSFLQEFAEKPDANGTSTIPNAPDGQLLYADLPLAAAARMSATFPYVSSASRVPSKVAVSGYHFVDGGYFDNDGTSSAVEFLHYAVANLKPHSPRLPILWIEVRNDPDLDAADSPDSIQHQEEHCDGKGKAWRPIDQLGAPPQAFYNASMQSDTRRNRRELCLLKTAHSDTLAIHHMVFDYRDRTQQGINPLNWELTPHQQRQIACAIEPNDNQTCPEGRAYAYAGGKATIRQLAGAAATWFNDAADGRVTDEERCQVYGRDHPTPPAK